jgi:hypothetical protein
MLKTCTSTKSDFFCFVQRVFGMPDRLSMCLSKGHSTATTWDPGRADQIYVYSLVTSTCLRVHV